jgi:serine/threonine-protein kinase RsbW
MVTADLNIASKFTEIARAREWMGSHARAAGLSERTISQVGLAMSEACTNVIKHAYRGESTHCIDLHLEIHEAQLVLTIHDVGAQFDLQAYTPPNLDEPGEGGYGVFLMRSLMDEVRYELSQSQGTTLRLVKHDRTHDSYVAPIDAGEGT